MATMSLAAERRTSTGKGAARKLRRTGRIPAVVYREGGPATAVAIDPHDLEQVFRKTMNPNTLVELTFDGGTHTCLVREAQRHPVSQALLHVDFYEVAPDDDLRIAVPVRTVGRAVGTRLGGQLRVIRRFLDLTCKPAHIPPSVDIDVTSLGVGQFIRVSQVEAPPGTKLIYRSDYNVVTVMSKRMAQAGPAALGAEAPEGEAVETEA